MPRLLRMQKNESTCRHIVTRLIESESPNDVLKKESLKILEFNFWRQFQKFEEFNDEATVAVPDCIFEWPGMKSELLQTLVASY